MKRVAVVGSGPAALMAAEVILKTGHSVTVFEKKKGLARKLLIAGSSGLNITNSLPLAEFINNYTEPRESWQQVLHEFTPKKWIQHIEELGSSTFEGTSGRYFVKEMKASKLLRAWLNRLKDMKCEFALEHEVAGLDTSPSLQLHFRDQPSAAFDAVCFCLGGGSYEPQENPVRWPQFFIQMGLKFTPFTPSNVGYRIKWSNGFLKECEGLPIKNICLTSSRGSRKGDCVVTRYGIEGTPVYFVGTSGVVHLDLKPDLTAEQILKKCLAIRENLSPIRRVKKQLALCPASLGLLFHQTAPEKIKDINQLVKQIKRFPLELEGSQSLDEAISSSGGLDMNELNSSFMLKKYPGVFAAGEMLDWDAPTGGFLIQGSVSQGYAAGQGVSQYLFSSLSEST